MRGPVDVGLRAHFTHGLNRMVGESRSAHRQKQALYSQTISSAQPIPVPSEA
jgi:hypothetical protein